MPLASSGNDTGENFSETLLRGRCRSRIPCPVQRMVQSLLEAPSAGRSNVGVFVVAVVLDLVGIATETDHEHVDGSCSALRRGCDDVVDVKVTDALFNPADVLATA